MTLIQSALQDTQNSHNSEHYTQRLPNPLPWRFSQCFGERSDSIVNADIISALEFDDSGSFLATGDRGGRVVIFKDSISGYTFFAEFQSHEPEFDYLKSIEIDEKINKIKWCKHASSRDAFLLTANDTTIKLWKLSNRSSPRKIIPSAKYEKLVPVHQKSFKSQHVVHINSISPNIDGLTFLSSDDLRISLWRIEDPKYSLTLIDMKPSQLEDLQEVITTASFHPQSTHQFLFTTSKGVLRICDTRLSSICDNSGVILNKNTKQLLDSDSILFGDILTSISDAKFSPCGRYVLARDFQSLRLWDTHKMDVPLTHIHIPPDLSCRQQIQNHLLELYETEALFEDKFECGFDGNSRYLYTGSYNNMNYIFDLEGNIVSSIFSDKSIFEQGSTSAASKKQANFSKKILSSVWNPNSASMAIAAANNLFIFRSNSR